MRCWHPINVFIFFTIAVIGLIWPEKACANPCKNFLLVLGNLMIRKLLRSFDHIRGIKYLIWQPSIRFLSRASVSNVPIKYFLLFTIIHPTFQDSTITGSRLFHSRVQRIEVHSDLIPIQRWGNAMYLSVKKEYNILTKT